MEIRRELFHGDALPPLIFVLSMTPVTNIQNKMNNNGYEENDIFFSFSFFFGKGENDIQTLITTIARITTNIKKEFGLQKSVAMNIKKRRMINMGRNILPG